MLTEEWNPQYADEVGALYGMPVYQDNVGELADVQTISARDLVYTAGLRLLAEYRAVDRHTEGAGPEPDEKAVEWNRDWMPGIRGLRAIGREQKVEVERSVRRLAMLNNFETFMMECGGEDPILWPDQQETMKDILTCMRSGGRRIMWPDSDGGQYEAFVHGVLAKDPTGSGKTVVMARTAVALGIGQPVPACEADDRLRMLIVSPSQDIVKQLVGDRGDDTLRRHAPGIKVSAYYESVKDKTGDVVATTIHQFIDKFRHGMFDGERFDVVSFDEVHHLTAPKVFSTYRDHWDGTTLGFTATPRYNPSKDARLILPDEAGGHGLVELIQRERLNAAQLLTFGTTLAQQGGLEHSMNISQDKAVRREAAMRMMERGAVELAAKLMAEGRRGIIFTSPGKHSASARRIAWQLPQWFEESIKTQRTVRVEALGHFRTAERLVVTNDEILQAFDDGDVDALVTVKQGLQGFNADLDFVIIATPVQSLLQLEQMIGRGTRRSKRFPTTVYAQFLPGNGFYSKDSGYSGASVFDVFGVEASERGEYYIGPSMGGAISNPKESSLFDLGELSPSFMTRFGILDTSTRHEVVISADNELAADTEGKVRLDDLDAIQKIGRTRTVRILDAQRVNWTGVLEGGGDKQRLVRWYDPADIGDLLNFAAPTDLSLADISKRAGISVGGGELRRLVSDEEWSLGSMKRPVDKRGGMQRYWPEAEGSQLVERLKGRVRRLPPNLIPRPVIPEFININYMTLVDFLKRQEIVSEKIRIPGGQAAYCLGWGVARQLADVYGLLPGAPDIDFDRLPQGPDDTDEDRLLYARAVQTLLMPANRLRFDEDTTARARELAKTLRRRS